MGAKRPLRLVNYKLLRLLILLFFLSWKSQFRAGYKLPILWGSPCTLHEAAWFSFSFAISVYFQYRMKTMRPGSITVFTNSETYSIKLSETFINFCLKQFLLHKKRKLGGFIWDGKIKTFNVLLSLTKIIIALSSMIY